MNERINEKKEKNTTTTDDNKAEDFGKMGAGRYILRFCDSQVTSHQQQHNHAVDVASSIAAVKNI